MKLFVAAKAVILNSENKILIVREGDYDEGTNTGRWDFPGGRLESDETLDEGLDREVKEEVSLEVKKVRLLDVMENFPVIKGEKVHIVRLYFECYADSPDVHLSKEHNEFLWVSREESMDYDVMAGEIIKKLAT